VVLHLAAQPLVRYSYVAPVETYAVNVMGTVNLLEAVRRTPGARTVVNITTDKCYENREWVWPYREGEPMGGADPYSSSKACSELVTAAWRASFLDKAGIQVASARAGNVIGGGDWSEDRLIPDAVRAWGTYSTLDIRRPAATRPWQHVLEPLAAYLRLAEHLWQDPTLAGAYNFGPHTHEAATVRQVISLAQAAYGGGSVHWGDGNAGPHEARWLALETAKARTLPQEA